MREVSRQMLLHKHIHLDLETTAVCMYRTKYVRDGTLMPLGENVGVLLLAGQIVLTAEAVSFTLAVLLTRSLADKLGRIMLNSGD